MKSLKSTIASVFLSKLALLISVFIFTGYNQAICAIPQECVRTELIIADRSSNSDQTYLFGNSLISQYSNFDFRSKEILKGLRKEYICRAKLIVKTQSSFYLDFKAIAADLKSSIQHLAKYPSEHI